MLAALLGYLSVQQGRCDIAAQAPKGRICVVVSGSQSGAEARSPPPGLTKSGLKVTICRLSALQTVQGCWFGDLAEWSKALPC
jgi:hypothetical protein